MRGSPVYQVQKLWLESGINRIGESKHHAKACQRERLASSGSSSTSQNIAKGLGVFSYSTADAYREVWVAVLVYAKSNHGVKDVESLTGDHVAGFLKTVVQSSVKYSTFQQYAAAATKLGITLSWYAEKQGTARQYDFADSISDVRKSAQAQLEIFSGSRAYQDPFAVRMALSDSGFKLAAALQHTGGARISEVALIRPEQMKGEKIDDITGTIRGYYEAQGKGGKIVLHHTDLDTYRELEKRIAEQGVFRIDKNDYRAAIKQACAVTGNTYQGSHGFRWCYATERFDQCMASGRTYEQSLAQVSSEMSHNRVSITEHYRR